MIKLYYIFAKFCYFNRDKHKRFTAFHGMFFHTLPSSSTSGFSSTTGQLNMYNGSHANSSSSSMGSFYNGRVVNALSATGTSSGTYTYNICPKNWTLHTTAQQTNLLKTVSKAEFAPAYAGFLNHSSHNSNGSAGYWWSRTTRSNNSFDMFGTYPSSSALSVIGSDAGDGVSARCLAK